MACKSEFPLDRNYLCSKCAQGLARIKAPCPSCGRENNNKLCDDCARGRSFTVAISAYRYNRSAKGIVLALKYRNDKRATDFMANAIAEICDITHKYDVIVGVPSRLQSYVKRGYNQSDEISAELSSIIDIPVLSALKVRGKIKTQHFLTKEQRAQNYADGLYCTCDVTGLRILLVDDVITTCSTAEACSRVLLDAGADSVHVAAFASVSFKQASLPEKPPSVLDILTQIGRL